MWPALPCGLCGTDVEDMWIGIGWNGEKVPVLRWAGR
jgi:hypothetical protein